MPHSNIWESGLKALVCYPTDSQLIQLKQYVDLLDRWNKTYNLTSVRDPKEMITFHIFDSLVVAGYIKGDNCLDVGSGAGLPTIPLAIMQPDREFTALDANGKKTRFIQQATIELGLKNVDVEQARIENWKAETKFDAIISRAFASVYDFVTSSSQHLSAQGTLYAMKGQFPNTELNYLPKNYILKSTHTLNVPFLDGERHLLEISYEA